MHLGSATAGRLVATLLKDGLLSQQDLVKAVEIERETSIPLSNILLDQGFVGEGELTRTLADLSGLDFVDLDDLGVDPTAAALIPEPLARRHLSLPVAFDDNKLVVAMADPSNILALDDIRAICGLDVIPMVASRSSVEHEISQLARMDDLVSELTDTALEEEDKELGSLQIIAGNAPVVKLVNTIISRAILTKASDIHIEPGEEKLRVRFRIDGVLHELMSAPRSVATVIVSRMKIMAELDISEKRVPQDGRISVQVGEKRIDLRVATLPSIYGEKVVMRVLDKSSVLLELTDLGFLPDTLETYEVAYTKPYGCILFTGPTGSGKSTTMYATLNVLNKPDVNIITVEDPVEYRMAGLTQIQINPRAGLTFASVLRAILRADPDIVLLGEIRDRETAKIGIEAALTGHMVLSTLHTNDAPSSVSRLIEMGIEPYLVSSAVVAVVAQRLARRLCSRCKQTYQPTRDELERVGWNSESEVPQLFRAAGCGSCSKTGYSGRVALHEIMILTEEIQRMAVERCSSNEIGRLAVEQGMRTLRGDGCEKVLQGVTSLEEMMRVVA
ncbi:MAG: ATPase, T2SS/T4P/T4SS family [Acidobacteriota bacterium]|nr:ATPase, T2SS/T4P/T4SS family [Acidobacteriota bacterium]